MLRSSSLLPRPLPSGSFLWRQKLMTTSWRAPMNRQRSCFEKLDSLKETERNRWPASPEDRRTVIAFRPAAIAALVLLACNPRSAVAFPWSIDMFRGDPVQPMSEAPRVMPPDTLPVDGERPRSTAASRKLQNPLAAVPTDVEEGGKLYSAYCSVCHGAGGPGDGPSRFILRTAA